MLVELLVICLHLMIEQRACVIISFDILELPCLEIEGSFQESHQGKHGFREFEVVGLNALKLNQCLKKILYDVDPVDHLGVGRLMAVLVFEGYTTNVLDQGRSRGRVEVVA